MPRVSGARALAQGLAREGVRVVFGLPGEQIMHALDALYDHPEIRFLTTRHEQGTTYLADGYARAGGREGVALVVPGVGVTNASAGLATAWACSSPVLLLAGQVNRAGIGRDMELLHSSHDQLELVKPMTKWRRRALTAAEIPGALHEAFRQMRSGRPRPVARRVPARGARGGSGARAARARAARAARARSEGDRRSRARRSRARRARCSSRAAESVLGNASEELTALAELLQAPVLTTREGKGAIDDRNPLSVGTMWINPRLHPFIARPPT